MLAIPLKETKGVDWSGPLRAYISTNYSAEELDKHASSVQRLSTTRERVGNATPNSSSSVEALESYLGMLGEVEPRFPLGEGGLKLSFTWFDSLKPQKKLAMSNVEWERASVLYNLASLLSHQGMMQDRSDINGLKKACVFFQRAAGIFMYLKDDVVGERLNGPVLSDMSAEGLDMVAHLMLAQAQACFYEKAIRDELKPPVLSKLSAQAHEWYGRALDAARSRALSPTLDPAWAVQLEFQHRCFAASTQFQYCKVVRATAQETTEGYGEEIARLGLASQLCEDAIHTAQQGKLPASMLETVQHLRRVIHTRMDAAADDNNKIYMQVIPSVRSLDKPPGAALAKPLAPDARLTQPAALADMARAARRKSLSAALDDTVFAGLLPVVMQEAEVVYMSTLSHMVEQMGAKVEDAAAEVKLRLAEAGLPAAVEAGDAARGLPDAVWKRLQDSVASRGGVGGLESGLADNEAQARRIEGALREAETKLHEEERADSRCRQTWGAEWNIRPSAELNTHMRGDVARYRSMLGDARSSDGVLRDKLHGNLGRMEVLGFSRARLDQLCPAGADIDANPQVEATRVDLALMLVNLGSNLQECERLQGRLVDATSEDSIAEAMANAPGGPAAVAASASKVQALVAKEAAKYKPLQDDIERRIRDQPALLSRVLDRNHEFSRMRNTSEASLKREGVIAEIDAAIRVFDEIATYVAEGSKFYGNLAGRAEQLRTTAADHCFVRDLQRAEIEQELTQRFGGSGGSGAGGSGGGGSYPGMASSPRPGMNRQASVPFMTPYAVGGAAPAYPVDDTAPTQRRNTPPPAYPAGGGGGGSAGANMTSERRNKLSQMKSTLGTVFGDEELEAALEGADDDVNRAVNHLLGADAPPSAGSGGKRTSKKRFGLFSK